MQSITDNISLCDTGYQCTIPVPTTFFNQSFHQLLPMPFPRIRELNRPLFPTYACKQPSPSTNGHNNNPLLSLLPHTQNRKTDGNSGNTVTHILLSQRFRFKCSHTVPDIFIVYRCDGFGILKFHSSNHNVISIIKT